MDNIPLEEVIARVCHAANRAYCESMGHNSQPPWDEAPEWERSVEIRGVQLHLATLKAGEKPGPGTWHEKWMEKKRREGWCYGPVEDAVTKRHPHFLPYVDLPMELRMKNHIFVGIVGGFFEALESFRS